MLEACSLDVGWMEKIDYTKVLITCKKFDDFWTSDRKDAHYFNPHIPYHEEWKGTRTCSSKAAGETDFWELQ